MDLLAHALWAWAGGEVLRRRGVLTRGGIQAGVAWAVAPDLLQMAPVAGGLLTGSLGVGEFIAYATADPGQEPILSPVIAALAHHLHCAMHSVVVVAVVTALVAWGRRAWAWPLFGWWLHIAFDVPTHSADYYAVPVLYPFTYRGFDGVAWNTTGFLLANYLALAVTGWWLWRSRHH